MKQKLLSFCLFFITALSFSQAFDVETIKSSGDPDKRINIVILGDGYMQTELADFREDAVNFSNALFSQSPFLEYTDYFNVHIINVISNESGASHPQTTTDAACASVPISSVDNFFGSAYDSFGSHRLLYTPNYSLITNVLATNFPEYDQALILVNAPYYGGSGGDFPMSSTGVSAHEIAIHEIGHSLVNLKDEYYPGDFFAEEGINMTQQADPSLVKWSNWVTSNGIGVYPYCASGSCASWYRPHQRCKMRYLGDPFCAVCREGIIEKIHDLISPIDSFSPANLNIETQEFPINFDLSLIHPTPHTLEILWTLNGSTFDSNEQLVSVLETDLNPGINNLSVVVTDNTSLQRIDNHETIHITTISWSINKTTLGTTEVHANENHVSISMYPNPTSNEFFVTFDSLIAGNLRLEITSMDGKHILYVQLESGITQTINLNNQAAGLYIARIYSDSVLLGSKKIIKK